MFRKIFLTLLLLAAGFVICFPSITIQGSFGTPEFVYLDMDMMISSRIHILSDQSAFDDFAGKGGLKDIFLEENFRKQFPKVFTNTEQLHSLSPVLFTRPLDPARPDSIPPYRLSWAYNSGQFGHPERIFREILAKTAEALSNRGIRIRGEKTISRVPASRMPLTSHYFPHLLIVMAVLALAFFPARPFFSSSRDYLTKAGVYLLLGIVCLTLAALENITAPKKMGYTPQPQPCVFLSRPVRIEKNDNAGKIRYHWRGLPTTGYFRRRVQEAILGSKVKAKAARKKYIFEHYARFMNGDGHKLVRPLNYTLTFLMQRLFFRMEDIPEKQRMIRLRQRGRIKGFLHDFSVSFKVLQKELAAGGYKLTTEGPTRIMENYPDYKRHYPLTEPFAFILYLTCLAIGLRKLFRSNKKKNADQTGKNPESDPKPVV